MPKSAFDIFCLDEETRKPHPPRKGPAWPGPTKRTTTVEIVETSLKYLFDGGGNFQMEAIDSEIHRCVQSNRFALGSAPDSRSNCTLHSPFDKLPLHVLEENQESIEPIRVWRKHLGEVKQMKMSRDDIFSEFSE